MVEHECTCVVCGDQFKAGNRYAKYCTRRCKDKFNRSKPRVVRKRCAHCGGSLSEAKREGGAKYCSRACYDRGRPITKPAWAGLRSRVRFIDCKQCSDLFVSKVGDGNLCGKCKDAKAAWLSRSIACAKCGRPIKYKGTGIPPVYCSKKCRPRTKGPSSARKRARKFGVEYQYINPRKIFERDGWRRQICGKPTPEGRRGSRHSNAPELDHRIPMSIGGGHVYGNVQCACRACNSRKSNRSSVGQLPLYDSA